MKIINKYLMFSLFSLCSAATGFVCINNIQTVFHCFTMFNGICFSIQYITGTMLLVTSLFNFCNSIINRSSK